MIQVKFGLIKSHLNWDPNKLISEVNSTDESFPSIKSIFLYSLFPIDFINSSFNVISVKLYRAY